MTTKTDGGPAFPFSGEYVAYEDEFGKEHRRTFSNEGLSIRDYFAAKFAAAWVLSITSSRPTESREAIGIEANRLGLIQADHMLNQRNKS
jgi:hypothetical protein